MQTAINGAVGRGTTLAIAAGNSNANTSGLHAGQLQQRDRGGVDHQHRPAFELLQLRRADRHRRAGFEHPVDAQRRHHHAGRGELRELQRHVDGDAARRRRDRAAAVGGGHAEDAGAGRDSIIKANFRPFPVTPSQTIGPGILDAKAVVDAAGGGGGNVPPAANFSFTTSGLTANFTDTSTDSDGTIASRSWNFGDGTTSTATNPSKTYAAAGTYTVTLTVTDDDGATNTKTSSVTVGTDGRSQTYTNGTDFAINDNATVESPIAVSGRTGNAPTNASVSVNIVHTYSGDLQGGPGRARRQRLQPAQPHRRQRGQSRADVFAQPVDRGAQRHLAVAEVEHLAVVLLQTRLVVVAIDMAHAPLHEQEDHALGAGLEVRLLHGQRIGGRSRLADQTGQGQGAESAGGRLQRLHDECMSWHSRASCGERSA